MLTYELISSETENLNTGDWLTNNVQVCIEDAMQNLLGNTARYLNLLSAQAPVGWNNPLPMATLISMYSCFRQMV